MAISDRVLTIPTRGRQLRVMYKAAIIAALFLFGHGGTSLPALALPHGPEIFLMAQASAAPQEYSTAQEESPAKTPPKTAEEKLASQRFSEFNHRFAGFFVLLIALLTVLEPRLAARFGLVRYLWSVFFLIPGIYLFFFSDPESWPLGSQTLHYVITSNAQVLQHKIFSLLLLGLSAVEFLRARGKLQALWTAFLFPAMAAAGAALLFFHAPPGGHMEMSAAEHLIMQKINHQHFGFAVVGFGIAVSKAAVDTGRFHPRLMRNIFAVLMGVLGLLLLFYAE